MESCDAGRIDFPQARGMARVMHADAAPCMMPRAYHEEDSHSEDGKIDDGHGPVALVHALHLPQRRVYQVVSVAESTTHQVQRPVLVTHLIPYCDCDLRAEVTVKDGS